MKTAFSALAAATLAIGLSTPALADDHGDKSGKMTAEVVEKNAQGKATKVKLGDKVYDVCMKSDQDGCINPREAGLNFGNRALDYWPGKPASQIDGPLPVNRPANSDG